MQKNNRTEQRDTNHQHAHSTHTHRTDGTRFSNEREHGEAEISSAVNIYIITVLIFLFFRIFDGETIFQGDDDDAKHIMMSLMYTHT